eukprot:GHVN01068306.1.p1 GENE.GHVN01068306.1~~GHVN01068306.1.p1  ORF type:complete len:722 (-),score=74.55 GHVN01068306.1:1445-3610(-)
MRSQCCVKSRTTLMRCRRTSTVYASETAQALETELLEMKRLMMGFDNMSPQLMGGMGQQIADLLEVERVREREYLQNEVERNAGIARELNAKLESATTRLETANNKIVTLEKNVPATKRPVTIERSDNDDFTIDSLRQEIKSLTQDNLKLQSQVQLNAFLTAGTEQRIADKATSEVVGLEKSLTRYRAALDEQERRYTETLAHNTSLLDERNLLQDAVKEVKYDLEAAEAEIGRLLKLKMKIGGTERDTGKHDSASKSKIQKQKLQWSTRVELASIPSSLLGPNGASHLGNEPSAITAPTFNNASKRRASVGVSTQTSSVNGGGDEQTSLHDTDLCEVGEKQVGRGPCLCLASYGSVLMVDQAVSVRPLIDTASIQTVLSTVRRCSQMTQTDLLGSSTGGYGCFTSHASTQCSILNSARGGHEPPSVTPPCSKPFPQFDNASIGYRRNVSPQVRTSGRPTSLRLLSCSNYESSSSSDSSRSPHSRRHPLSLSTTSVSTPTPILPSPRLPIRPATSRSNRMFTPYRSTSLRALTSNKVNEYNTPQPRDPLSSSPFLRPGSGGSHRLMGETKSCEAPHRFSGGDCEDSSCNSRKANRSGDPSTRGGRKYDQSGKRFWPEIPPTPLTLRPRTTDPYGSSNRVAELLVSSLGGSTPSLYDSTDSSNRRVHRRNASLSIEPHRHRELALGNRFGASENVFLSQPYQQQQETRVERIVDLLKQAKGV